MQMPYVKVFAVYDQVDLVVSVMKIELRTHYTVFGMIVHHNNIIIPNCCFSIASKLSVLLAT